MDRRTTRPRTKTQPQQPVNEVPSAKDGTKNGDHDLDSIEPDLPSSEGDIPVASLIVEEIKSSSEVTYKIESTTTSVNGGQGDGVDTTVIAVKGPVPDVVTPSPSEGKSEESEENGQGDEKVEEKDVADENGVAVEENGQKDAKDDKKMDVDIDESEEKEEESKTEEEKTGTKVIDDDVEPKVASEVADDDENQKTIEEKSENDGAEEKTEKVAAKDEKVPPKVNGKSGNEAEDVDTKPEIVSPPKKSRRARELNNLVSTLVGAEEPVIKEEVIDTPTTDGAPKSRSGRVLKLKTPSKDELEEETPKRKRQPKTPKVSSDSDTGADATAADVSKSDTPIKAKALDTPKSVRGRGRPSKPSSETPSSAPYASAPSAASASSSAVHALKKAPQKRLVVFPFHQKLICSREDLLRIPVKIEEADHFVGDLIWSKVTGYPYWPCMVTIDPLKGVYTELDEKSGEYVYHVQYFGDSATRSWTRPKGVFKFEGYDHYKSLEDPNYVPGGGTSLDTSSSTPKVGGGGGAGRKSGKKLNPKYAVPSGQRKDWKVAVAEAEFASSLNLKSRIDTFTYIYEQSEKSDLENRKRKAGDSSSSPGAGTTNGPRGRKRSKKGGNSSPEDVYDFDEDFDGGNDVSDVSRSPLKLMSLKKKGDFTIFVARERSNLKKSNPGLKEVEIDKLLEKNWEFLPEDQKLKYVNRTGLTDSPSVSFNDDGADDKKDDAEEEEEAEDVEEEAPEPEVKPQKKGVKLNRTVKPRTPACLIARKPRKSATPLKAVPTPTSEKVVEKKTSKLATESTTNLDILDQPLVIDDIEEDGKKKQKRGKTPTKKVPTPAVNNNKKKVSTPSVATTTPSRSTPRRGSKTPTTVS